MKKFPSMRGKTRSDDEYDEARNGEKRGAFRDWKMFKVDVYSTCEDGNGKRF
jgi:hypothetical protein